MIVIYYKLAAKVLISFEKCKKKSRKSTKTLIINDKNLFFVIWMLAYKGVKT